MANLVNPETKHGKITDTYVNWNENPTSGKKSGGIVVEVEFDDTTKKQKLYSLTEKGAEYTVKSLRSLGWSGTSFSDFEKPQLVGMEVSVVLADSTDKDGNVRCDDHGIPYREIAFINRPGGYRRASKDETSALARHFDRFLNMPKMPAADDDDLPF